MVAGLHLMLPIKLRHRLIADWCWLLESRLGPRLVAGFPWYLATVLKKRGKTWCLEMTITGRKLGPKLKSNFLGLKKSQATRLSYKDITFMYWLLVI